MCGGLVISALFAREIEGALVGSSEWKNPPKTYTVREAYVGSSAGALDILYVFPPRLHTRTSVAVYPCPIDIILTSCE